MSNRSNLTLPYQSIERSFKIQPEFFEMEFKSKQSSMTIWKMNQLALIKWKFSNCNSGFCFVICVSRARWINWVPLKFIVQLKSIKKYENENLFVLGGQQTNRARINTVKCSANEEENLIFSCAFWQQQRIILPSLIGWCDNKLNDWIHIYSFHRMKFRCTILQFGRNIKS